MNNNLEAIKRLQNFNRKIKVEDKDKCIQKNKRKIRKFK